MINVTNAAIFFLAAGIFTSVSLLSVFQILFSISIGYFTYLAFKEKKLQLPKSSWWILAFLAIAILSLIINHELIPKPTKNWGRLKYYLYGVTGIFVLRYWLHRSSTAVWKFLANTFFTSIIIAGLFCSYQVFIEGEARASSLTETMRYGYGTGMALLIVLSCIIHRKDLSSWLDLRFASVAFVIGFLGMYLTLTRGALLGFVAGLPFVLFYYNRKLGLLAGLGGILGVLILGYFYFFGSIGDPTQGNRFLMNKNNSSDVMRRSQWKAAVIAIKEKPILGWGLSNFHSQLRRIKEENDLDYKNYNDAHSHNLFLEIAAGTGLIGLFLFLGWLLTWAVECFKTPSVARFIVPFGAAFCTSSQFEVTFDANNATMIFFLYSLSVASLKKTY